MFFLMVKSYLTDQFRTVCECRQRERQGDLWTQTNGGSHAGYNREIQDQGTGARDHEEEAAQHYTGAEGAISIRPFY